MWPGDDKRPQGRLADGQPDNNIFDAIVRYADQQMASFLQNTIGLPSAVARQNRDRWLEDVRAAEAQSQQGPPRQSSDTQTEMSALISSSLEARAMHNFLTLSEYSPVALDQYPGTKTHNIEERWREAFQDLLREQAGNRTSPSGKATGQHSGPAWLLETLRLHKDVERYQSEQRRLMIERLWTEGIPHLATLLLPSWQLGPVAVELPSETGARGSHPTSNREADVRSPSILELAEAYRKDIEAENEQSLYEAFLSGKNISQNEKVEQTASTLPTKPSESRGSEIISTVTTTEQVTMPDGTTETKLVFKKKFADGRVESRETVHTGRASDGPESNSLSEDPMAASQRDVQRGKERSGWFW